MGNKKKMKLPFLSSHSKSLDPKIYSSSSSPSSQPWPFPSCGNIRTLSFKAKDDDDAFRTFNSAFLEAESSTPPESYFSTVSSSSRSFSTMSDEESGDPLESSVFRGLRSKRLFFDPQQSSSLLLCQKPIEEEPDKHETKHEYDHEKGSSSGGSSGSIKFGNEDKDKEEVAYKESEILSMESNSPYEDFKKSMEEMVEAHELKDWQGLEELLGCYLKINGKNNHGYIVGAFIDLLVSLSFTSFESTTPSTSTTNITPTTTTTLTTTTSSSYSNYSSPSSPLSLPSSSLTTPCLSSILDHGDDDDDEHDGVKHDDDDDDHVTR